MQTTRHVDLNVHSKYSQGESVVTPEEIVNFAARDGATAIAITDLNNMLAAAELSRAVRKHSEYGIKAIYGVRMYCSRCEDSRESFLLTLLAKNKAGQRNIYRLISSAYRQGGHAGKWPCTTLEEVAKHRRDVLLGVPCTWQQLADAQEFASDFEQVYTEFQMADYVELPPWTKSAGSSDKAAKHTAQQLAEHFQAIGKLPVAVSNANCITQDDALCLDILRSHGVEQHEYAPRLMKTTEAMLEEYAYLGESMAQTVVLNNPTAIADRMEVFDPMPPKAAPVRLANAEAEVKAICDKAIHEKYGAAVPETVRKRYETECELITRGNAWSYYLLANRIAGKCEELGMDCNYRGSAGSSFVAYLAGSTGCNPLPPHYYCPECKLTQFVDGQQYASGFDLLHFGRARKKCPVCGTALDADGHNIAYEFFAGMEGQKKTGIVLDVPAEAWQGLYREMQQLFGSQRVAPAGVCGYHDARYPIRANQAGSRLPDEQQEAAFAKLETVYDGNVRHPGKIVVLPDGAEFEDFTPLQFLNSGEIAENRPLTQLGAADCGLETIDILPDPMLSAMHRMEIYTGVRTKTIRLEEIDIAAFFQNDSFLGLPFHTAFSHMLSAAVQPTCFSDLLKMFGFAHGTNAWTDNAEKSIGTACSPAAAISSGNDIMLALLRHGVARADAFRIAMAVRAGRGLKQDTVRMLQEHEVDERYIAAMQKIRYLPYKAHAVAYVTRYMQMIWYKLHYPTAFHRAVLT